MSKLDEDKKKFIAEAKIMSGAAYNMMNLWEGELQDALHNSQPILEAYSKTFPLSFDEWWHQLSDFIEVVETELVRGKTYVVQLSVSLKPGDERTPGQIDDDLRSMFQVGQEGAPGRIQDMQLALGVVEEYRE